MANDTKGKGDSSFQSELDSLIEKHDKAGAERQKLLERGIETVKKKAQEFRAFKTAVIKPLLEQTAAKFTQRGYNTHIVETDEPEPIQIGIDLNLNDYIGFTFDSTDTLRVKLEGQPLIGASLVGAFHWKRTDLMNENAIRKVLLIFVDRVLARVN